MVLITRQLMFAVITASFGSGFHHGYNFGVLDIPTKILQRWINETISSRSNIILEESRLDKLWQITKFLLNIGAVFGGLSVSAVCNKYGPKSGLLLNNILAGVATILMAVSKYIRSIEAFFVGRLLIGVSNGLTVGLCPMYITEIAPVSLRGALGSFYHLFMMLSYFLSEVFGLPYIFGNDARWPMLFVVPIFIIILQVVALCFCMESPRYLMIIKNDPEKAEQSLKFLRQQEDVTEELKEIRAEIEDTVLRRVTFRTLVTSSCYRFSLYVVLFSMLAQQLTGINAVKFFTHQVFNGAGFNNEETVIGVVAISAVHTISAFTAVFTTERLGRKYSLLYGFGGMAVDNLFLAISMFFTNANKIIAYLCIFCIFAFTIIYGSGSGPVPWYITAELFNQVARPAAYSITVPLSFLTQLTSLLLVPLLSEIMDAWIFMVFVGFNLMCFIFMLMMMPVTRNRTIRDITHEFE